MDSLGPPPTTTGRDKFVEVARAAAGEVPVLGSVAEVLVQIFGTGYERRHEAWTRQLWSLMVDLERRSLDLSDLVERPGFVSAVHEASRIALGEHLEEKLEMLQAVLLHHAVGGGDRSADIAALRYLRLVDLLEPEHVEVLRVCFPVDTPRHRDHHPAPEQSDTSEISLPSDRPIEPPDAGHIELSHNDVSLIIGELESQLLARVSRAWSAVPTRRPGARELHPDRTRYDIPPLACDRLSRRRRKLPATECSGEQHRERPLHNARLKWHFGPLTNGT